MDDIDLLNLYRYPEFYPPELVARMRASKAAQKRLEGLVRQAAQAQQTKRGGRDSRVPVSVPPRPDLAQNQGAGEGETGNEAEGQSESLLTQFIKFLKK